MLNGYSIIDADAHVFEPPNMWAEYLEPAFKQFAPYPPEMKIKGEKIYHKISHVTHRYMVQKIEEHHPTFLSSDGFDPESQIGAMEQMKIDVSFLYPSIGLWVLNIDTMPSKLAGAFTRAYNNWLRDFCSYQPEVLKGVGAISLHAPEQMVSELHRIVQFGWKAVFICPNPVKGRLLSDPAYELFWRECEQLEIAVGLHECGSHGRLPTTGADRFNTQFAMHACSHPMEQMMALLALIEGGVLERYPKLKVAFLESGCGWLPYWLWRLDEEYEKLYWEVKDNVKLKPSEYFRRQCFISIEPSELYLPEIIDYIGSDNLLFGSDYPHWDHSHNIIEQIVNLEQKLSREIVGKILWDNPACFYSLA